jgi:ABC-type sugar transport system ATPase subunit
MFGATSGVTGQVVVNGKSVDITRPRTAIEAGIAMLPESRKEQGLFLDMSQRRNATITCLGDFSFAGVVQGGRERRAAHSRLTAMGVTPLDLEATVGVLSGGNQQKVLFAKTLMREPKVLILDEPTRGVDVGARREIYDVIVRLLDHGMGVILISSEFEEVSAMSHRLCVMRDGCIVAEFDSADVSQDVALSAAFGISDQSTYIQEIT